MKIFSASVFSAGILMGCFWDTCPGVGPIHQISSSIHLDLVSRFDSVRIEYISEAKYVEKIPIHERIEESLADTIRVVFYGLEHYYENRIQNRIILKDNTVQVKHFEMDSVGIIYADTSRGTQVLKKTACTPAASGFAADSIWVNHSSVRKVETVGKTE